MKIFKDIDEYTDDDLIYIVYFDQDGWQKEAVQYARKLLSDRGVTEEFVQSRIPEIADDIHLFWQEELYFRENESYSSFELIFIGLFCVQEMFLNWHLRREGYLLKSKQRLWAIGLGIVFYTVSILYPLCWADTMMSKHIKTIHPIVTADSLRVSSIDWSGDYYFTDSSTNKTIVWYLVIQKEGGKHKANLSLVDSLNALSINCVGVLNEELIEFFPDTTYQLYDDQIVSYYDRLFALKRINSDIHTTWDKMTPFNIRKVHGLNLFVKTSDDNSRIEY